jgi:hypothetical protein
VSEPRKTEWVGDIELTEMDIVRGILLCAQAGGLSLADLVQTTAMEEVETLEAWEASVYAAYRLRGIMEGEA